MRILVVCAANMCRSPAAAHLLRVALSGVPDTLIRSAGVSAVEGAPACPVSAETAGYDPAAHSAHLVTVADLTEADLVLAADRDVRAALARLAPRTRPRTYTLRQAAALASLLARTLAAGALPEGAPALAGPGDRRARTSWLMGELDAARGRAGTVEEDVPDPHGGTVGHEALGLLPAAVRPLAAVLTELLADDAGIAAP